MTSHWAGQGRQVRAPSAELMLTPPASAPRTGDEDLPAGCACTPLQQSVDAGTVKFANPKQSLAEVSSWPTAGTQARILNARCRCKAVAERFFLLLPTFLPRKLTIDVSKLNPQSKLGIFLLATGRMYFASVTSDLCPVCSRICQGCNPFSAALVQ